MRLLLITQQFRNPWSGLGTYARSLVLGLAERGHDVTLAVPESQCDPDAGIDQLPLRFPPWNVTPFTRRRMAREVRRVIAAAPEGLDGVHFLDAREASLIGDRAGLSRLVGSVHDSYALDWRAPEHPRSLYADRIKRGAYYAWLRRIEKRAYRRLDRIAANSRFVADTIRAGYGLPEDRVTVVRYGLLDARPISPSTLPGEPSVLFVGGGFQRKGLPVLIEAIAVLRSRFPEIHLHVVGGDRRRRRFQSRARELRVGEAVTFHGLLPNDTVRAYMAGADIFAMPSFVEAVGLVYLEAMQAGTPTIAAARGGTPEYLTDGEDALLVPPGDAGALAEAIGRLSADEDLRKEIGKRGRETARRASVLEMVTATEKLFS